MRHKNWFNIHENASKISLSSLDEYLKRLKCTHIQMDAAINSICKMHEMKLQQWQKYEKRCWTFTVDAVYNRTLHQSLLRCLDEMKFFKWIFHLHKSNFSSSFMFYTPIADIVFNGGRGDGWWLFWDNFFDGYNFEVNQRVKFLFLNNKKIHLALGSNSCGLKFLFKVFKSLANLYLVYIRS